MLRELVTRSPLLVVPLSALFLFLSVFVGALIRTYGRKASAFDAVARLPLDEEQR
ncbi:CcoQ/FixQ family Cbb3-type cytochrome c oxidase assembly chaperone [Escherichia coli]|nr:CcoQ/FixQ family Cbb3-type cytochrome c oxidase assembly chaperone [Escherichia coli]